MDKLKATIKTVQCLRLSTDDSAGVVVVVVVAVVVVAVVVVVVAVVVVAVVVVVVAVVVVAVVVVFVVVELTFTSKLALTIVLPWRIISFHKPLTKIETK